MSRPHTHGPLPSRLLPCQLACCSTGQYLSSKPLQLTAWQKAYATWPPSCREKPTGVPGTLSRTVSPDSLANSLDLLPPAPSMLRALAGIVPAQQQVGCPGALGLVALPSPHLQPLCWQYPAVMQHFLWTAMHSY